MAGEIDIIVELAAASTGVWSEIKCRTLLTVEYYGQSTGERPWIEDTDHPEL